jgi:ribonuclease HI
MNKKCYVFCMQTVPGHEGSAGNETTDQLARMGPEHPFTGPEPACGNSTGVARMQAGTGQSEITKNIGNV